jgi:Ca2+-binding RTX toxin-like protein
LGGDGNDTITGSSGVDVLDGGVGTGDQLFEFFNADVTFTASKLTMTLGTTTEVDTLSGFESAMLFGGASANRMDTSGSTLPTSLFGGNGNDVLIAGSQSDLLDGQGGNDTLTGGGSADMVIGGSGNDVVREIIDQDLTLTNSTLIASGNALPAVTDTLMGIEFADLSGGVSRNKLDLSGFTVSLGTSINGGGGNDTIVGSPAGDMILTLSGADSIQGLGSSDTILSGSGNDTISGGDGIDNLNGQNGDDSILGDAGNDVLAGGAGKDTLSGGAGDDFLSGQTEPGLLNGDDGNDVLQGNSSNDTINGGGGDDRLIGQQGDDQLNGGDGADTVFGGLGNDTINGGAGADDLRGEVGSDVIDGGADADRINEVFDTNVTVTGLNISTTTFGSDTVTNVERINLVGGIGNNLFDGRGATVPLLLSGLAGNDTLLGGTKADVIDGGDGDDVLSGGAGNDLIEGGAGTDFVTEKADTNFIVNGVTIVSTATGTDTPTNVERIALIGGAGANKLDAALATLAVILLGKQGNDTLIGSSQNDSLIGGGFGDLTGGVDSINGDTGTNVVQRDAQDSITNSGAQTLVDDIFTLLPNWVDRL